MEVLEYIFELITDISWFNSKKLDNELRSRIDNPSNSKECLTIDNGKYFLVGAKLNYFSVGYKKGDNPRIPKKFTIDLMEPINSCKYPVWKISFSNKEYLIKRNLQSQWKFFEYVKNNNMLPFCIYDFCNPWFLFLVSSLDSISWRKSQSIFRNTKKSISNVRSIEDILNKSDSSKRELLNEKEILKLCREFNFPVPKRITQDYTCSGTSFPEQAICFYVRKAYPDCNIYSRDNTFGKEIDIYIADLKIGIEYNGARWHNDKKKDKDKYEFFKQSGVRILEVYEHNNNYISGDMLFFDCKNGNIAALEKCIKKLFTMLDKIPPDINIKRDQKRIYLQFRNEYIINSLGSYFPDSIFWWSSRNFPLTPFSFKRRSDYLAWLQCPFCGFMWQEKLSKFSYNMENGVLCPRCDNQYNKTLNLNEQGFSLNLLLPEIVSSEYEIVEIEDGKNWYLNGVLPRYVFCNNVLNKLDLLNFYLNGKSVDKIASWFKFISMFPERKSWWHCCSCEQNFIQSYNDYFNSTKCPKCGNNKKAAKNIEYLNKVNKKYLKEIENEKINYLNTKLDEYTDSLSSIDSFTIDNFLKFVNSETNNYGIIHSWDIMKNSKIMNRINKIIK